MLKPIKRIHEAPKLTVERKNPDRSLNETSLSSLSNIDPYPESRNPPKIDLELYQLENLE
jgi:hypothetical protein